MSSNLSLKDKRLSVQAKKPFQSEGLPKETPTLLGELDDVRTPQIGKLKVRRWMEDVRKLAEAKDEALLKTVERIKALKQMVAASPEKRLA